MYKILKHRPYEGVDKGVWVNDSEGIPMEFDTFEGAATVAKMFQNNTQHGYTYTPIAMNESKQPNKKQLLNG